MIHQTTWTHQPLPERRFQPVVSSPGARSSRTTILHVLALLNSSIVRLFKSVVSKQKNCSNMQDSGTGGPDISSFKRTRTISLLSHSRHCPSLLLFTLIFLCPTRSVSLAVSDTFSLLGQWSVLGHWLHPDSAPETQTRLADWDWGQACFVLLTHQKIWGNCS